MNQIAQHALQDFSQISNVPFLIIDGKGREVASYPKEFAHFYKVSFLLDLVELSEGSEHSAKIVLYQMESFYYCAVTRLEESCYLVTAPTCSSNWGTDVMLSPIMWYIDSARTADFKTLISDCPSMSTHRLRAFANIVRLLYGVVPAEETYIKHLSSPHIAKLDEAKTFAPTARDLNSASTVVLEKSKHHHAPNFEERTLNAIVNGDVDAFLREHYRPLVGSIGQMSLDPLRQAKYAFLCAIFPISRAAIQGGVPSEYAFQISDTYCQRMDELKTVQEVEQLLVSAGVDFCQTVQHYQPQRRYSAYTKVALEYIRVHLFEPIKMEKIAFEANLNRRSLAHYFQKDTGLSISEYIMQKRLEEAKLLLSSTNLAIVQISERLQFSSQSYFGKKYREYWGITPKEYRNSLR